MTDHPNAVSALGLGGEKKRWREAASNLQAAYNNVTGDILVSSGIVAYLGPYTSTYRQEIVNDWVKKCREAQLTCSENFSLRTMLGNPVKIRFLHENSTLIHLQLCAFSVLNHVSDKSEYSETISFIQKHLQVCHFYHFYHSY